MHDVAARRRLSRFLLSTLLLILAGVAVWGVTHGEAVGYTAVVAAAIGWGGAVALIAMRGRVTPLWFWGLVLGLRLLAFPLLPELSDDGYRYVWDGKLQHEGVNPYAYRPTDPALAPWRDGPLFPRLNSAGYYSVYPPASQVVFWAAGFFEDWQIGWYVIKALFLVLEGVGLWALSRLVALRWAILYAWHPLAVLEIAGQGHTEAGMVAGLLVALWAVRTQRGTLATAALTAAGWFKLYPLVMLPFLFRRIGWRYVGVAIGLSAVVWLPYWAPFVVPHVSESLGLYVRLFEFNAGPYYAAKETLRFATGNDWSKSLGPLLQGMFLLGLAALYFYVASRRWGSAWLWIVVLGLFLATATTVHPWYLLGVLAVLPATINPNTPATLWHGAAWFWLALASVGTYLLYSHGPFPYWTATVVGWGGWAFLLIGAVYLYLLPRLMQRRGRAKWRWIRMHVPLPERVLDLGAGEGYVGLAAYQEGAAVQLADVVDFNRTDLPHQLLAGNELPFGDDAFDATLLVFVLHHVERPGALLEEARRVTEGPLVVIESVVETPWDRWWLPRADRWANRLRSGGAMREQEEHVTFRSVAEWRGVFARLELGVTAEERRGQFFHRRQLFVLQ